MVLNSCSGGSERVVELELAFSLTVDCSGLVPLGGRGKNLGRVPSCFCLSCFSGSAFASSARKFDYLKVKLLGCLCKRGCGSSCLVYSCADALGFLVADFWLRMQC